MLCTALAYKAARRRASKSCLSLLLSGRSLHPTQQWLLLLGLGRCLCEPIAVAQLAKSSCKESQIPSPKH